IAERRAQAAASALPLPPNTRKKPPHILVVDDEMSVREIIYRALIQNSKAVSLAVNAEECRRCIESEKYDIILLDYVLPEMNADRLLPLIKEKNPSAKIIMISGWSASPVKKAALEKQVDGWIDKPFNVETIIRKVESLS
ncbi:MAG: response regulator, partial [Spirochaetota bacterium]